MTATLELKPRAGNRPVRQAYWLIAGPLGGPVGHVCLECSARGVCRVRLTIERLGERLGERPGGALPLGPRPGGPVSGENHSFLKQHPWARELIAAMHAYLEGEIVSFDGFPVDLTGQPAFRRRVLEACRRIPYGKTITYAELAALAGNPAAVRAAASAMSHNPVSLIIPCHRVVRSDGTMGRYSAPGGGTLKARLIEMEENAVRENGVGHR